MSEALDFNDVSLDSFHLICRLCLCAGQMEPLFDTSKLEMYRRITLLEASHDDKLPRNICNFCSDQLKTISAFVEICRNSHSVLKKNVEKFEIKTEASLDKIDQSLIDIDSDKSIILEANFDLESILNDEKSLFSEETRDNCKTASDDDDLETASATLHKSVLEEIETDLKECGLIVSILSSKSEEVKMFGMPTKKKPTQKIKTKSEIIEPTLNAVVIEEKKCKNCGKIVKTLKQHYKKNPKCWPKNFLCAICGKKFSSNDRLSDHLRSHSKEQPFKCKSCSKAFSHRGNLMRHELIHTGIKKLLCHFCGKVHLRHDELRVCLNRHAGKKVPKYGTSKNRKTMVECKVCKKLKNKASINFHMQFHDKKCLCNICGKKFANNNLLEIHVRYHTGEKPFKCNFCNKDFTTRGELKVHTMSHTGEKPLKCQFCSKRFRQRPHLKVHLMTHTGEKPYVCDVCNKGFIMKGNFVAHKRLHTGERPFECKLCDKSYCDGGTLRKHVVKAHKNDDKNDDSNER